MYPMEKVFEVLDQRIRLTGRQVWVSYLLLQGQNDTEEHAKALVQLIKRDRPSEVRFHVQTEKSSIGKKQAPKWEPTMAKLRMAEVGPQGGNLVLPPSILTPRCV
eukprot:4780804-Amphidinium_carterae.1